MKQRHQAAFKSDDVGARLRLSLGNPFALILEIRAGLRVGVIDDLARLLGLSTTQLTQAIAMTPRTLARRKVEGRLRKVESDHVARIVLILSAAVRLYSGDISRAATWICAPNRALAGATPLDLADTAPGYQEVCDLVVRIEHGVFS